MATVVKFGVGYIVKRGVNDSNNSGFLNLIILKNGEEGLDEIIMRNSDK